MPRYLAGLMVARKRTCIAVMSPPAKLHISQ
jgi:hypothetical protein